MTVLSITAANVLKGSNATTNTGVAGVAVTAGQAVYFDTTTRKYLLSDADSATAAAHVVTGIALHGASLNQPLTILTEGDITIGATMTVGEIYVLDTTAGGIAPRGDLATGEYTSVIGVARTAAILQVKINNVSVALG